MPDGQDLNSLIGKPVGVALKSGQGVSGVLCSFDSTQVYILQYLYHTQFATMHYPYRDIMGILPFPPCQNGM